MGRPTRLPHLVTYTAGPMRSLGSPLSLSAVVGEAHGHVGAQLQGRAQSLDTFLVAVGPHGVCAGDYQEVLVLAGFQSDLDFVEKLFGRRHVLLVIPVVMGPFRENLVLDLYRRHPGPFHLLYQAGSVQRLAKARIAVHRQGHADAAGNVAGGLHHFHHGRQGLGDRAGGADHVAAQINGFEPQVLNEASG